MTVSAFDFPDLATLFSGQIQIFILVLARLTAMLALVPLFGSQGLVRPLRPAIAMVLAVILFPTLPHTTWALPTGTPAYFLLVLREVLLGLCIGYVIALAFQAMETAGSLIDAAAGYSMVELFDPMTGVPSSLFGQFFGICATIAFLLAGGHLQMMRVLAYSFQIAPVGMVSLDPLRLVPEIGSLCATSFLIGLQLSGPVLMALLLLTLVMAVLTRVMPNMNVWILSMPLQIVASCAVVAISLPWVFDGFQVWNNHLLEASMQLLLRMR